MNTPTAIGEAPWTRAEMIAGLDEFEALYDRRPIRDNRGGMKAPHMFALWFMTRMLAPGVIVESGVYKGQSTWLLEKARPDARIISIDPRLGLREYISGRVEYSNLDFSEHDWSDLRPAESLVFFDDHQNAFTRLQQCLWHGFEHVIFEDNYAPGRGDSYSLKMAFAGAGFEPETGARVPSRVGWRARLLRRFSILCGAPLAFPSHTLPRRIEPNQRDARMLRRHVSVYHEFPPVFQPSLTRWGDAWDPARYPTPEPLLDAAAVSAHPLFREEAMEYTWMCYVRLGRRSAGAAAAEVGA